MARNTGRERVLFPPITLKHTEVLSSTPRRLYHQERDWTCSIACLRTILSAFTDDVPDEQYYIETYGMAPGPHYSRDVKHMGMLNTYDVIYGCDQEDADLDTVLSLMEQGYILMLEHMYNYAHWTVLLGFYPLHDNEIETTALLMYDPYYDEVRLYNADEFTGMWMDGGYAETHVEKDFIAVRKA